MLPIAECVGDCSQFEQYRGLLTDVPHIFFELTLEAITGLLLYPFIRRMRERWHREIDAEHGIVHPRRRMKVRRRGLHAL